MAEARCGYGGKYDDEDVDGFMLPQVEYQLRDIEDSINHHHSPLTYGADWQEEEDEVDGVFTDATDDSVDELLSHWDNKPDTSGAMLPSWRAVLKNTDICHRCNKKVYPVEKIDVGVVYHRSCFKCRVCNRQLTLQSFQREVDLNSSKTKEVYCSTHVPKYSQVHIDDKAWGIRDALEAQRQKALKSREVVNIPKENWNYDDYQNRHKDSLLGEDEREAQHWKEEFDRTRENWSADINKSRDHTLENRSKLERDRYEIHGTPNSSKLSERNTPAVKDATLNEVYPEHQKNRFDIDNISLSSTTSRTLLRQRSVLKSTSDFEKFGVFEAQQALEKVHRKEEDELYHQIYEERQQKTRALERAIKMEKESVVKELIAFFEKRGSTAKEREKGFRKIELYYRKRHQEQLKALLQELAAEEQAAASRMIEKHSNEMLDLIQQKDIMAGGGPESGYKIYDIPIDDDDASTKDDLSLKTDNSSRHSTTSVVSSMHDQFVVDSRIGTPEPPEVPKENLYKDPDVFKDFDEQAIKESRKDHQTFTDLVKKLSWRCESELQKVRAIFRWITIKDLNKIKFDSDVHPDSPLGLLRGIKCGTESYHDLFKRLCSYAGLHCEIIEGFSKGAGYRPGSRIQGENYRNQWTAVWVDGSWRFINCKWGARHVKGPKDEILTYKCDEFYFLTDPEQHIYQHFPDDPAWQLLRKPILIDEFTKLPVVKSPFFNNKLAFKLDYEAILVADDGGTEVIVKVKKLLPMASRLRAKSKEVPAEVLADRTLIRSMDNEMAVIVNLPCPGQYYLDLYVASDFSARSMDNACAFMIHCTGISNDANMTFPQMGAFGKTPYAKEYGILAESHPDPYIAPSCETTITFSLLKNIKLTHNFRLWDPRDRSLVDYDRYAFLKFRSDALASFLLHFPRRGVYVFSVIASNYDEREDVPQCVYKYFIECKTPKMDAHLLPKTSRRWKYCKLVEPLRGDLDVNSKIRFALESKLASEIVVVVNDQWYSLHNNSKIWDGIVELGAWPGKVVIYGKFDGKSEKYIPLLEYKLIDKSKPKYVYVTSN